jgi:hypothetical protein
MEKKYMTLKKAIQKAKQKKRMLKNNELGMYCQTSKSLIYWLITDQKTNDGSCFFLKQMLKSTDWELES